MRFAYDTEAMLAFTTALINTEPGASNSGEDELTSVAELEALLDEHEYSGRRDRDAAELEEIRGLRTEFRRYWNVDRDEAAEVVNACSGRNAHCRSSPGTGPGTGTCTRPPPMPRWRAGCAWKRP